MTDKDSTMDPGWTSLPVEELDALRAENERLKAQNERLLNGDGLEYSLSFTNAELRAEIEQLREECRLAAELQIRTGQEADAENERLQAAREQDRELADRLLKFANDEIERLQKLGGGLVRDNSELTQMLADLRAALEEIVAHPAPSNVAKVASDALARHMRA